MTENNAKQKNRFKTPPGYWEARKPALKALARNKAQAPQIKPLWLRTRAVPWLTAALLAGLALFLWQGPYEKAPSPLPAEAIVTYLQAEGIAAGEISAQEPPEITALFQAGAGSQAVRHLPEEAVSRYLKAQNPENILL
jgi:hypothetical protein